jgi:hypothetical protein
VPLTDDPMRPGCCAGQAICTRPVVAILTAGCVHEHIRRGRVCEHHASMQLFCRPCYDNPTQGHGGCVVHPLRLAEVAS